MLWRQPYRTKEFAGFNPDWAAIRDQDGRPIAAPPEVGVGVFSADDIPGAELWIRLIESERARLIDWRILACGVDPELVRLGLRPSWHARVWRAPSSGWPTDREFAWRTGVLMAGPPTEDAWESFLDGLSALEQ